MSRIAHKLISASGGEDAYEIEQSILLNHDDSSYLWYEPGAGGSRTTWTFSGWFKPGPQPDGYFGVFGHQAGSGASWYQNDLSFNDAANMKLDWQGNRSGSSRLITNRRFRDQTGWYHIVFAVDTTQGTASNRMKLYINGVQETSFSTETYPGSSENLFILKNGDRVNIGRIQETYFGEGYVAEVHVVDGSQLAPTSFGEVNSTTGQWVPIEYEGSHGTQGSYLKFASGAIGTDSSGNGNNWTAVNLANSDVMLDTPTNNYCTLNGNQTYNSDTGKLSQGNLFLAAGTYASGHYSNISSTFNVPGSGKWYAECRISIEAGAGNVTFFGVTDQEINWDGVANENLAGADGLFSSIYLNYIKVCDSGNIGTGNTSATASSYILGMALDVDNGYAYFGVDSGSAMVWYKADGSTSGGDPTSGSTGTGGFARTFTTDDTITVSTSVSSSGGDGSQNHLNFGQNGTFCGTETAGGNTDGNGYGNFFRAPPSGYLALCTKNLPTPTIKQPTDHFNTVLYVGNDTTNNITGVGFQPDLVWLKNRTEAANHRLHDAVRGADEGMSSNTTDAEADESSNFTGFASDGFSLAAGSNRYNDAGNSGSGENYVAWCWKANGSGGANNSGDINATVSANPTAGFSIVSWTGDSSNANTVAHGLGKEPKAIFYKRRDGASSWYMVTKEIDGSQDYLSLNSTTFAAASESYGNPTTSTISNWTWGANAIIAYVWAEIEGYSKFGKYIGNGSTNGVFVSTGFQPAYILIKNASVADNWHICDVVRSDGNPHNDVLRANLNNAESADHAGFDVDSYSSGFKIKSTNSELNTNDKNYFYMAFAEFPFKYANAR